MRLGENNWFARGHSISKEWDPSSHWPSLAPHPSSWTALPPRDLMLLKTETSRCLANRKNCIDVLSNVQIIQNQEISDWFKFCILSQTSNPRGFGKTLLPRTWVLPILIPSHSPPPPFPFLSPTPPSSPFLLSHSCWMPAALLGWSLSRETLWASFPFFNFYFQYIKFTHTNILKMYNFSF